MADPADAMQDFDWEKRDKQALLDDQLFKRGMNEGSIIAKFEPELYKSMSKDMNVKNVYQCGFLQAGVEYKRDLAQERLQKLNKARDKRNERSRGRER